MSIKEVINLLNDLKESHKQIALRLKLLELEIISIKENIPGRIINMIEKTEKYDKKVSQNYLKELLAKKVASKGSYKEGSMDEKLIHEFPEEQIKVLMNKGDTGGPQGEFGEGSKTVKNEEIYPEEMEKNFADKAKKNKDFIKQYHNDNKSKFMFSCF